MCSLLDELSVAGAPQRLQLHDHCLFLTAVLRVHQMELLMASLLFVEW
jgi:hypothetical protein